MTDLSIDIETYSSVDIKKCGLYKYVQSADFEVLLFAYSVDGGPVTCVDFTAGEEIPGSILYALGDDGVKKHAYNAAFEWYCLSKHFGIRDPFSWLQQWRCTMLHALYCGFPIGLSATGAALGLPEDKRKLGTGKALIKTFCVPCKPTKANGGRTRTLPQHEPEKWQLFKTYNCGDVITEMEIERRLAAIPVPAKEQTLWELDQVINARGVALDPELVSGALCCGETSTVELLREAVQLTGLDNPKSVKQLQAWLAEELDEDETPEDLQKKTVQQMLDQGLSSDKAARMLTIRLQLGKTSTKKYDAMQSCACADGRARGLLQHYGANRTGRWAGRLVQVQNLPKNYLKTLDLARGYARRRAVDCLQYTYGNVPDTLSQLIRTAFVPAPGNVFAVADFSAIEARVIAWLAGEQWRLEVFNSHGRIYEASASSMFGVPIEEITKGSPLRQKGKVAELALGYQGGAGALKRMGALEMGLTEDELPDIVSRWRTANPRIVDLWYAVETTALQAMHTGKPTGARGIIFSRIYAGEHNWLTAQLPSGRSLYYAAPHLATNRFGSESIGYMGMDQQTKKWSPQETYGGKLTENIVQAIARDCLAVSMLRLEAAGYPIVMHIHDEVVLDVPEAAADIDKICGIMGQPISWAPGLPLRADGFISSYYKKD